MSSQLEEAKKLLEKGELVAIPTETVYGLAGRIDNEKAIKKIFSTKERPFFDPLIVHVSDLNMAKSLTSNWSDICQRIADRFWPGPITLVLPKKNHISDLITSGLPSVGIRMPKHSLCLELIKDINIPLAAPSANKFKKTSPTKPEHVRQEFQDEVFILDGGACEIGIESTVLGVFEDRIEIYRPGMVTVDEIQEIVGKDVQVIQKESPVAPGQLKHHYMPSKPLTIVSSQKGIQVGPEQSSWEVPDNPQLCARELYSRLRDMDQEESQGIIFILDDEYKKNPAWDGILNRLKKAKTVDLYF